MTTYRTSSIKPDHRDKIPNGLYQFDVCEDCNNRNYEPYMKIRYAKRYKRALCDACLDCRDGLQWKNKNNYSNPGLISVSINDFEEAKL